jgi:hypothetical protein
MAPRERIAMLTGYIKPIEGLATATSRGLKGAGADQVSHRCNGI